MTQGNNSHIFFTIKKTKVMTFSGSLGSEHIFQYNASIFTVLIAEPVKK